MQGEAQGHEAPALGYGHVALGVVEVGALAKQEEAHAHEGQALGYGSVTWRWGLALAKRTRNKLH